MSFSANLIVVCALICGVLSLGDEDVRCVSKSCDVSFFKM